ncbi:purple acid phosphatase [Acrasis kona]|uniref:Purple acid phosphatase n=1 Tax=Acrasis kona TaxID=1008807 RepID=A0AAW2ZFN0_9EUKA
METDTSYQWLSWVNNYVTVPYKDNNVLSVSLMILLIVGVPLFWVVLPFKIFNHVVFAKPSKAKTVIMMLLYPVGIILSFLFGFEFILLLVMSTVGKWYIGGPLLFLFWTTCFVVLNRSVVWPARRVKSTNINSQTTTRLLPAVEPGTYQNSANTQMEEVSQAALESIDEEISDIEDEDDDFLHIHNTTAAQRFKIKFLDNLKDLRELGRDIVAGLYRRKVFSLVMIVAIGVLSFILSLGAHSCCISYYPFSISTGFTRTYLNQDKICERNTICFTYLTVPKDMSTSMIVNYQLHGNQPTNSHVLISRKSFVTQRLDENNQTEVIIDYSNVHQYESKCFDMNFEDEQRHQCWCDLTMLKPNTIYHYLPVTQHSNQKNITTLQEYKFKTGPPLTSDDTFTFVTGGDVQFAESGTMLAKFAAAKDPLFVMIGGDIAFANGEPECYRRWDAWFQKWMTLVVTSQNLTVPMLTSVGDHEASGFDMPREKNYFYLRYFPHQIGLYDTEPLQRQTFHHHLIGSHGLIVVLDSWIHTHPKHQTTFIKNTLEKYSNRGNNFFLYHSAVYPSKVLQKDTVDYKVVTCLHETWRPLFDSYNVSAAFENHFHLYKLTFAIFQDEIHTKKDGGTTYLGDGAWGLRSGASEDHIAKGSEYKLLRDVRNVAHVYVVRAYHYHNKELQPLGYAAVHPYGYDEKKKMIVKLWSQDNEIIV